MTLPWGRPQARDLQSQHPTKSPRALLTLRQQVPGGSGGNLAAAQWGWGGRGRQGSDCGRPSRPEEAVTGEFQKTTEMDGHVCGCVYCVCVCGLGACEHVLCVRAHVFPYVCVGGVGIHICVHICVWRAHAYVHVCTNVCACACVCGLSLEGEAGSRRSGYGPWLARCDLRWF